MKRGLTSDKNVRKLVFAALHTIDTTVTATKLYVRRVVLCGHLTDVLRNTAEMMEAPHGKPLDE